MENTYNDESLPEDFKELAKEYSKYVKDKNFLFVNLQKEEFSFLIDETLVTIAKMKSVLKHLQNKLSSKKLWDFLSNLENKIIKFYNKKPHIFKCVANYNQAFLSLVSLENILILKLLLLSTKSENFEFFYNEIIKVANIFSTSFDVYHFVTN